MDIFRGGRRSFSAERDEMEFGSLREWGGRGKRRQDNRGRGGVGAGGGSGEMGGSWSQGGNNRIDRRRPSWERNCATPGSDM